jgi:hypothetical protein
LGVSLRPAFSVPKGSGFPLYLLRRAAAKGCRFNP